MFEVIVASRRRTLVVPLIFREYGSGRANATFSSVVQSVIQCSVRNTCRFESFWNQVSCSRRPPMVSYSGGNF